MEQFDWMRPLWTLLATLVGALVAALISVVLCRHEVTTRKRGEVDAAVVALIREISSYSVAILQWRQDRERFAAESSAQILIGPPVVPHAPQGPNRGGIDAAIDALVVLTTGNDRQVAERARQVPYELTFVRDAQAQFQEYSTVKRNLVEWRSRKRTAPDTLTSLDIVDLRRAVLETGGDTGSMPPPPEPYVRAAAAGVVTC